MIIWLASYPKSGNTWVRTIINELLFNNNSEDIFNSTSKNIRQFPSFTDFENNLDINQSTLFNKWFIQYPNDNVENLSKLVKTGPNTFNLISNFSFLKFEFVASLFLRICFSF